MSNEFTSVIAINLTEQKFYVYSQSGILQNRIEFNREVEKYGEPCCVSSNGLNFIFKKTEQSLKDLLINIEMEKNQAELKKLKRQFFQDYMTVSVMHLSIFGFYHIKDINIYKGIEKAFKLSEENKGSTEYM